MAVTTDIEKFRLELGDTAAAHGLTGTRPVPDPEFAAAALFSDDEINYFLGQHPGSVLLAVAAACDALAARFAQEVDVAEDRQSFSGSQLSAQYAAMAVRYRARAALENVDVLTGVGLPTGRVPYRRATTWGERW